VKAERLVSSLGMEALPIELEKSQTVMLNSREWTDKEILRLLVAVEKYKDDWNKVGVVILPAYGSAAGLDTCFPPVPA